MTAQILEIPLTPEAQTFAITLGGQDLRLTVVWNDAGPYWCLSIADSKGVALLSSLPMVPGLDLLRQFYTVLNLPGYLVVQTDGISGAIPTYSQLGNSGHLYFLTTP